MSAPLDTDAGAACQFVFPHPPGHIPVTCHLPRRSAIHDVGRFSESHPFTPGTDAGESARTCQHPIRFQNYTTPGRWSVGVCGLPLPCSMHPAPTVSTPAVTAPRTGEGARPCPVCRGSGEVVGCDAPGDIMPEAPPAVVQNLDAARPRRRGVVLSWLETAERTTAAAPRTGEGEDAAVWGASGMNREGSTASTESPRDATVCVVDAALREMFANPHTLTTYVAAEDRIRQAFDGVLREHAALRATLLHLGVSMVDGIDLRARGIPSSVVLAVDPSRSTPAAALTPPVSTAALSDRGEDRALRRMLATATVRLEILRDRMAGCDVLTAGERREQEGHTLSRWEIEGWIEEQRRALTSQGGAR